MAVACPIGLDAQVLRYEVSNLYTKVATNPDGEFHFHRGPQYAAELLCRPNAPPRLPASAILTASARWSPVKPCWISVRVPGWTC
jgi:hypothetical protein